MRTFYFKTIFSILDGHHLLDTHLDKQYIMAPVPNNSKYVVYHSQ